MYHSNLLVLLVLAIALSSPSNMPDSRKDGIEKFETTESDYTLPDREPPTRTQGGGSRLKDTD